MKDLLGWARISVVYLDCIPAAKARDDPVHVPGMTEDLADNSHVGVNAIADGRRTPKEGASALQALASQARIIEADESEKVLAAL